MRPILWVLLLGLLTFVQAQDNAEIAKLASKPEEEIQHRTDGIIQAVEDVISSLNGNQQEQTGETKDATPTNEDETVEASEAAEPVESSQPADVAAVEESDVVAEAAEAVPEATEPTAEASVAEESEQPEEPEQPLEETTPVLSKKEGKAVAKYNEAVDQVLVILSSKLKEVGNIPIQLDEASLVALDKEPEPEPEDEPETTPGRAGGKKNKNNKRKNAAKNKRKNKRKNNNRKNKNATNVRQNNGSKKNSNNRSTEKGNKNNKNKSKNNKNKKNRNRKNNNNNNESQVRRKPKGLDLDEDDVDDVEAVEVGRRKNMRNNNKRNKQNKAKKSKKNRRNKNKKRNSKNKGRSDLEGREDKGPAFPTPEERQAANARLSGLSTVAREGDVTVDLSGKKDKFEATVNIGPLSVNLKDQARALSKAEVNTPLTATFIFKAKSVSRRTKLKLDEVMIDELLPEEVAVIREDLQLEAAEIKEAQKQVVLAVDTNRMQRILEKALNDILDEDNIVENLSEHPYLKKTKN